MTNIPERKVATADVLEVWNAAHEGFKHKVLERKPIEVDCSEDSGEEGVTMKD